MLLDTALTLIARDGEPALTLGAVADEAGIARATVYGYFTGKKDLLAALDEAGHAGVDAVPAPVNEAARPELLAPDQHGETVIAASDDALSIAANSEQTEFTFTGEPTPVSQSEPVPASEQPVVEETAEAASSAEVAEPVVEHSAAEMTHVPVEDVVAATETLEAAEAAARVMAEATAPEAIVQNEEQHEELHQGEVLASDAGEQEELTPFEQGRRLQATHLEEIAKRLILPESALREGTDAVISRLDTRLRVLERSITGLETRQSAIPAETANKVKPISDLVTQLQTRADAMEDRQRQALAELRLSIHELTARQSALGSSPITTTEMPVWPEAGPTPVEAPEKAPGVEPEAEKTEEQIAADNARSAYLSTARNLAKEGARQAAERESQFEEDQRRRRRQLLTAAGVAGVCLVAVGALFVFRPGPHGVSVAQSKSIARVAQTKGQHVFASGAPLDRLTALANRGDARAEVVVGIKYLKGDGVTASDKDAARWFERAAKSGNAVAENHLGALYQAGRGVPADVHLAMHWYEAAAMQGDRRAMSNLAVLYAGGAGGTKNFAEATRWFQRSAELGFVDAQFNLAVLFERGDGVPQSLLDAYKWYSIAAAAGDPVAKARAAAIETQVSPEELQAAQLVAANFTPRPLNNAANDVPTMADVLASR